MRPGPEGNDGVKIAKTSAGRSIPIKITCTAQPQDTSASAKRPRRNTTLTPKAAAAAAAAAEEAAEEDDEEASAPAFAAVAAPAKPLIVCLPSSGQALLTKEERALKDMYAELRAQREAEASARAAVASDSSAHARTMAAAAAASGGGGGGGSGAQKLKRPSAKKSNRPAPTHTPMLGVNETAPVGVHAFQAAGAPQVAWPEW